MLDSTTSTSTSTNTSVWLTFCQTQLSCILQNWTIHRSYPPSLVQRIEGYTECWGNNKGDRGSTSTTDSTESDFESTTTSTGSCWDYDKEDYYNNYNMNNTTSSTNDIDRPIEIRLVQFRPAWMEQLVLKLLCSTITNSNKKINYIIQNSSYAVTEVTGPLPYIQILQSSTSISELSTSESTSLLLPSMIGRYQQQNPISAITTSYNNNNINNAIIQYLCDTNNELSLLLFKGIVPSKSSNTISSSSSEPASSATTIIDESLLLLLQQLILHTIVPHYNNIHYTYNSIWKEIYSYQSLVASSSYTSIGNPSKKNSVWTSLYTSTTSLVSFFSNFQTWCERIHNTVTTSTSSSSNATQSNNNSVQEIRKAYSVFEKYLADHNNNNKTSTTTTTTTTTNDNEYIFVLGTNQITIIDILLFDHLMNALCDVQLIIVLADYPNLIQFITILWNKYFAVSVTTTTREHDDNNITIEQWNYEQNLMNPFCTFPIVVQQQQSEESKEEEYQDVDQFMTLLSSRGTSNNNNIQNNTTKANHSNLQEQLLKAKKIYNEKLSLLLQQKNHQQNHLYNITARSKNNKKNRKKQKLTQTTNNNTMFSTWYRWRMGDSYYPKNNNMNNNNTTTNNNTNTSNVKQQQQQPSSSEIILRREYRRNDQIWITSISVLSISLLVYFGLAGYESTSTTTTTSS